MRDDAPDPCEHLSDGRATLERRVELESDEGLVEALVACRTCGATSWLSLLDVDPAGGPLRVYAASGIARDTVDTYLERGGRASCDPGKGRREVEAVLSNAGAPRLVVVCDARGREVVAAGRLGLGEIVPLGPWRERVPPPDDGRWFSRAGLDKPRAAPDCDALLEHWFGAAAHDAREAARRMDSWFGAASAERDRALRGRFGCAVAAAGLGALEGWQREPRGALGLVLLLDQLPRSLWRGGSRAFAHDAQALSLASRALARGHLDPLGVVEQVFLLMPFQHVESLALQRQGVALYERVLRAAAPEWQDVAGRSHASARDHLEIVERFGRFPHRNAALGRSSTREELAYLQGGGEHFGQEAAL